jgi:hypothetical protein
MLSRWADAYARQIGEDVARVRRWISFMALGGALEQAGFFGNGPKFSIKGGVALELRLQGRARATRDIDLVLNHPSADPVEELDAALRSECEGFSFRRRGDAFRMPNGAIRTEVAVQYGGKVWGRVQVDLARRETDVLEVEMVDGLDLSFFRFRFPEKVPCLSIYAQAAQKIHAMTLPSRPGWQNDRFKDVVDLLLIRELVSDREALRDACEQTFAIRNTHPWPPLVEVPESWADPFAEMAGRLGLPITDIHHAVYQVRTLIHDADPRAALFKRIRIPEEVSATTWYYAVGPDERVHRLPVPVAEALVEADYEAAGPLKDEWQRNPGGVLVIGIVVILQQGNARWIERSDVYARAVDENVAGTNASATPAVWRALATELSRRAKVRLRGGESFASFLAGKQGQLPYLIALMVGVGSREQHRAHASLFQRGVLEGAAWDLAEGQPVEPLRSDEAGLIASSAQASPQ